LRDVNEESEARSFQNADNSNLPFTPTLVQLGGELRAIPPRKKRMVSITIRNISKRFGDVVALNKLNLEIRKGELFFLLGPSGCGKTTLLRTVAGFYAPDEGNLYFDSDDVTRLAAAPAQHRHGVSELRPLATHERFPERELWPPAEASSGGGD